jgi:hypothetical protein
MGLATLAWRMAPKPKVFMARMPTPSRWATGMTWCWKERKWASRTLMGIHHVHRHLQGVEVEVVLACDFKHVEVDGGIFVASETDVTELAGLAGGESGFERSAGGEDGFGVGGADDFVELDEVDGWGLETAEGVVELGGEAGGGVAVGFGHEEDLVAVALEEGVAHALFAAAAVVVPGVVHEGDAAVDGGADEASGLGVVRDVADVGTAEADGGDLLAGAA